MPALPGVSSELSGVAVGDAVGVVVDSTVGIGALPALPGVLSELPGFDVGDAVGVVVG